MKLYNLANEFTVKTKLSNVVICTDVILSISMGFDMSLYIHVETIFKNRKISYEGKLFYSLFFFSFLFKKFSRQFSIKR